MTSHFSSSAGCLLYLAHPISQQHLHYIWLPAHMATPLLVPHPYEGMAIVVPETGMTRMEL